MQVSEQGRGRSVAGLLSPKPGEMIGRRRAAPVAVSGSWRHLGHGPALANEEVPELHDRAFLCGERFFDALLPGAARRLGEFEADHKQMAKAFGPQPGHGG